MRIFRVRYPPTLLAALALCGCQLPFDGYNCTASIEPAIVAEIRDAVTGTPLALGATAVVRDGAYVDTLTPYERLDATEESLYSRRGAEERPGSYSVEVRHPGYVTWTTSGVGAGRGKCHVETKRVRVGMVRE